MSASHCTEGCSAARGWQSELFSSLSLKSLAPETQRDTGLTQLCYFRLYIKTVSLENQSQCNSGSEEIKRQCLLSLFQFSVIVIQNFTATIKVKTSPKSGGRNLYVDLEIVGNLFLIMKWHLTFICWPFSGTHTLVQPTGWTSVPVFKSEWTINTKIEAVSCNNPLKPQTVSSCSLHQFINHVLWLVNQFPHFITCSLCSLVFWEQWVPCESWMHLCFPSSSSPWTFLLSQDQSEETSSSNQSYVDVLQGLCVKHCMKIWIICQHGFSFSVLINLISYLYLCSVDESVFP